jgi:hypothetical protein
MSACPGSAGVDEVFRDVRGGHAQVLRVDESVDGSEEPERLFVTPGDVRGEIVGKEALPSLMPRNRPTSVTPALDSECGLRS